MDQLEELENTFLEEYSSSQILLEHKKLKSVTILLSKSLFALADYLLFKKYNILPKNHAQRFRILEKKEKKMYEQIDELWGAYTNSYSKPSDEVSIGRFKKMEKRKQSH